jgi:hypothetical protein
VLPAGNGECAFEMSFSSLGVLLPRYERDFASDAIDLGLPPRLSPATRLTSASHRVSFVVSIALIVSPMQHQASSYLPISAYALAKHDNHHGTKTVAPVERHAAIPEVMVWTASAA